MGKKRFNREVDHEQKELEDRCVRGSCRGLPSAQGSCPGSTDLVPSWSSWPGAPPGAGVSPFRTVPASTMHTKEVLSCPFLLSRPDLAEPLTPVRGPWPIRGEPVVAFSLSVITCGLVLLTNASCGFMANSLSVRSQTLSREGNSTIPDGRMVPQIMKRKAGGTIGSGALRSSAPSHGQGLPGPLTYPTEWEEHPPGA